MLRSEARLDHDATTLYRLRYAGYTGDLGGVLFVRGEAQGGVTLRVVQRLQGIFGARAIELVGPWEAPTVASPEPEHVETVEDLPLAPPAPSPSRSRRARRDEESGP